MFVVRDLTHAFRQERETIRQPRRSSVFSHTFSAKVGGLTPGDERRDALILLRISRWAFEDFPESESPNKYQIVSARAIILGGIQYMRQYLSDHSG